MDKVQRILAPLMMSAAAFLSLSASGCGITGKLGAAACPALRLESSALDTNFSANAQLNGKVATFVQAAKDMAWASGQLEAEVSSACRRIGTDLGVPPHEMRPRKGPGGASAGACTAVSARIDAIMRQGIRLWVTVTPHNARPTPTPTRAAPVAATSTATPSAAPAAKRTPTSTPPAARRASRCAPWPAPIKPPPWSPPSRPTSPRSSTPKSPSASASPQTPKSSPKSARTYPASSATPAPRPPPASPPLQKRPPPPPCASMCRCAPAQNVSGRVTSG